MRPGQRLFSPSEGGCTAFIVRQYAVSATGSYFPNSQYRLRRRDFSRVSLEYIEDKALQFGQLNLEPRLAISHSSLDVGTAFFTRQAENVHVCVVPNA